MSNAYTFDLRTPADLLAKIRREVARLKESTLPSSAEFPYQADHAVNAANCIWHMIDWLWKHHENRDPMAAVRYGYADFWTFHSTVRKSCVEIDQCYNLATGAKHVVLTKTKTPAVVQTSVSHSGGGGMVRGLAGSIVGPIVRSLGGENERELVVMATDGTRRNALEVMERATVFWETFFANHGAEI